jgi:formylglycine-generating enzyme required for sulfatase activity
MAHYKSIGITSYPPDSRADREQLAESIKAAMGPAFDVSCDAHGIGVVDTRNGVRYRFIPGGEYLIGFTDEEEQAARRISDPFPATIAEMRPPITVNLPPFLMSDMPITNAAARRLLGRETGPEDFYPARLTKGEADAVVGRLGGRLPAEFEWESACRGRLRQLFPFGDELPNDEQLARWMNWDLSDRSRCAANRVGLYGLFFGEWCRDEFRSSYAPDAPVEQGSWVVRGGGAFFWPWQDEEWVWCMSAMRMPSSALPPDQRCSARCVMEL